VLHVVWPDRPYISDTGVPRRRENQIGLELLVMGLGQKILTRVGSGQIFVARAGSASLVWVWIWKISLKNAKFFNFLPFGLKKSHRGGSKSTRFRAWSASYLLWVKSMFGSGQGPSLRVTP